ncbi:hypothetical protein NDI76_15835 [Halogeometricum sp. S1BR25-6]|uniref:Uncharacterized protein n=1 Tax=Halogeometricum salsisoli TaxID=2950536 RepID=A0ABU2GJG8_9EURY|nr:hypothetical protein [Halogeometricum sp. S1BR25-6]MDS0300218.1 hypothetical protein [Halogeometricum sp. S1BR25-6]
MTEAIQGEVLHVVPPTELDEHDLTPSLQQLAESRYVVVLRKGGHPSLLQLLWAFIRRQPLEAVTIVTEDPYEEGDEVTLRVEETELVGVYRTV